jgi:hypothetical protein
MEMSIPPAATRASLPLVANQQEENVKLTGGAREETAERRGAGVAFGSQGSTRAMGAHRGPDSTVYTAATADVLAMKATTLSKSSSSQ